MGLKNALGQLGVVAAILTAGCVYIRHHVNNIERVNHTLTPYMEDSKAGNGTRYKVLKRSEDTAGAYYTVEALVRGSAPGFTHNLAGSTPAHMHPAQEEVILVKQGSLGYVLGVDQHKVIQAGQQLTIPQGTSHYLYNADNKTELVYELTHSPAGPMGENFFENLAGLGWAYTSSDRIHPLQVLVLWDAAGTTLTEYPALLQPVVAKLIIPIARQLGFKAEWPSHDSSRAGDLQNDQLMVSTNQKRQSADSDEKEEL